MCSLQQFLSKYVETQNWRNYEDEANITPLCLCFHIFNSIRLRSNRCFDNCRSLYPPVSLGWDGGTGAEAYGNAYPIVSLVSTGGGQWSSMSICKFLPKVFCLVTLCVQVPQLPWSRCCAITKVVYMALIGISSKLLQCTSMNLPTSLGLQDCLNMILYFERKGGISCLV